MNRSEKLDFAKFPVYFPVTREFVAETGSTVTASATTHSPKSLLPLNNPANSGLVAENREISIGTLEPSLFAGKRDFWSGDKERSKRLRKGQGHRGRDNVSRGSVAVINMPTLQPSRAAYENQTSM
jgi:hypothetical protein